MSKNISITNELFAQLKELKGEKSYSMYISSLLNQKKTTYDIIAIMESIEDLKERISHLETQENK